nr:CoA transferase [Pseudomonadota bacterium]
MQDKIVDELLSTIGVKRDDVGGQISIAGADPVVSSRFRIGGATSAALAAQGAAIAAIWRKRTGRGQDVFVELRRAAVPGLRTAYHLSQNGYPVEMFPRSRYPQTDFFRTRDGRQIYILRTPLYIQNLLGTLALLNCSHDPVDMARAVSKWDALELEESMADKKLVGVMCRTRDEWLAHPQGAWLAARPPVEIEKIGGSDPMPLPGGPRPLSGLRVLDAAHVLAGPVTSRMLAEHGADVL